MVRMKMEHWNSSRNIRYFRNFLVILEKLNKRHSKFASVIKWMNWVAMLLQEGMTAILFEFMDPSAIFFFNKTRIFFVCMSCFESESNGCNIPGCKKYTLVTNTMHSNIWNGLDWLLQIFLAWKHVWEERFWSYKNEFSHLIFWDQNYDLISAFQSQQMHEEALSFS